MSKKTKNILASILSFLGGVAGQRFYPVAMIVGFIIAIAVTAIIADAVYAKKASRSGDAVLIVVVCVSFMIGWGVSEALA